MDISPQNRQVGRPYTIGFRRRGTGGEFRILDGNLADPIAPGIQQRIGATRGTATPENTIFKNNITAGHYHVAVEIFAAYGLAVKTAAKGLVAIDYRQLCAGRYTGVIR